MKKSLTKYARSNLQEVHALSKEHNGRRRPHKDILLKLVREHVKEIEDLHGRKDGHFSTEVGDLMILCYELLLEDRKDLDRIMEKCYDRYKRKLKGLLKCQDR